MRAGRIGLVTASTGVVLLVGGCSQPAGIAGVRTAATPGPSSPTPAPASQGPAEAPDGGEPVRVPPPKLSDHTYTFPVEGCEVSYQRKLLVLPKTTIWARRGCAFVAPVDGVVHEVNTVNRWAPSTDVGAHREGRFVTIAGDDGVLYLGGHLDSVAASVKPGVRVKAGRVLGRIGTSGNARDTGPNLYFAISWKTDPPLWWVRRGMVEPWDYLDAWKTGNRTFSPRKETLALRRELGETPPCRVLCGARQPSSAPSKTPTPTPTRKRTRATPTPEFAITLSPTESVGVLGGGTP
ncbi:peptidoglycan DD-metalloendopeptidase family protein [Nonomuraea sp. MCN248]|uniref:Peptidoglycan DD-metalloendopeptidase family protein n=1 Tax=Nonomuraea corallina TaxID=2989783 RepID=A0ABT4SL56_9ACTN|nr:peptidoglycan DD-metalloendopeptidase family protein [Nonomuraea corallina]MDA0637927.1 peptidoglycan DD-metalloendopeptidase family protein [Nonomuraea corallina]